MCVCVKITVRQPIAALDLSPPLLVASCAMTLYSFEICFVGWPPCNAETALAWRRGLVLERREYEQIRATTSMSPTRGREPEQAPPWHSWISMREKHTKLWMTISTRRENHHLQTTPAATAAWQKVINLQPSIPVLFEKTTW